MKPAVVIERVPALSRRLTVVALALALSACALTRGDREAAPLAVEDESGFTIPETQRIASHLRGDYEAAIDALSRGDHAVGIAMLEALVVQAPALVVPRIDLATAHHQAGNLEAAETHLLIALQASPGHPVALNELGIVYRKTGRFDEARRSYEAALTAYPGYHYAHRNLAVLCDLYLGDLACARDHYAAFIAASPGDADATMWLASVRMRLDQEGQ